MELQSPVDTLLQLVMPLFLAYRIAIGLSTCLAKNGNGRSARVQDDIILVTIVGSACRLALSPTVHYTFCGSNW